MIIQPAIQQLHVTVFLTLIITLITFMLQMAL
nr:MAG TPA_asm: hypothetical protein [Bacteriophage sp.]